MQFDHTSPAEHKGLLNDIFKFPYITGVVIFHQVGHCIAGNPSNIFVLKTIKLRHHMIYQQRNIFATLIECGQCKVDHTNTVVKIFPEFTCLNKLGKIFICSSHDPYINLDRFYASQRFYNTFLKDPQESNLECRRNIGNLIKKYCSTMSQYKATCLIPLRVCKCTCFMAEEFAFQKGVRKGSGINRNKTFFLPR